MTTQVFRAGPLLAVIFGLASCGKLRESPDQPMPATSAAGGAVGSGGMRSTTVEPCLGCAGTNGGKESAADAEAELPKSGDSEEAGNTGSSAAPSSSGGTHSGGTGAGDDARIPVESAAGAPSTGGMPAQAPPENEQNHYLASAGFVVHEWGTNTLVSGSDGSLQLGLQHEEEDLPPFVYDRMRAALAEPFSNKVTTKMETPVLYFYSPAKITVRTRVDFPSGILTQWYPGVQDFGPPILWETPANTQTTALDPALDASVDVKSAECVTHFRRNGWLDWGSFEVLSPGTEESPRLEAPLGTYTWGYAREVGSNSLRFPDGESEQFLFYRGVSNAVPPSRITAMPADQGVQRLRVENTGSSALGAVFVIQVGDQKGAFAAYPDGVAGHAELVAAVPEPNTPLQEYTQLLAEAVTRTLELNRLYHDEALSMVNTWRRQWFKTPGIRVLYLAPESWTAETIPLTIEPTPKSLVRLMMMRVEVLTPELEASDLAALDDADADAIRAHFSVLGRFAEPRLRRALAMSASPAGFEYLAQLVTTVSRSAVSQ